MSLFVLLSIFFLPKYNFCQAIIHDELKYQVINTINIEDNPIISPLFFSNNNDIYIFDKLRYIFHKVSLSNNKIECFSFDSLTSNIKCYDNKSMIDKHLGKGYKVKEYLSFLNCKNENSIFVKVLSDIIIKDGEATPILKYYIVNLSPNQNSYKEIIIDPHYVPIGSFSIVLKDHKYYLTVYDQQFYNLMGTDSTKYCALVLSIDSAAQKNEVFISYDDINKAANCKYSPFLSVTLNLNEDYLQIVNAEIGLFANINCKNKEFFNFINMTDKLLANRNAHKAMNFDDILNGKTYSRNCMWTFTNLSTFNDISIITIFENIDKFSYDYSKLFYQVYNKNGDMIAELQDLKFDAAVMRSPIMLINNKLLRIVLNDSELSIQQITNIPG